MWCDIKDCDDCIYPDCILTETEAEKKNKLESKKKKATAEITPRDCGNCAWGTKTMCQGGLAIRCINGKLMETYERCKTWTEK